MNLSRQFKLKRDQIWVLIAIDFKLKYNSTALGFAWSLLVPILSSLVYFFAFGVIMRFRAPNYLLYLLCGTFFWQFFSNVVTQNGRCLISNASLLKKTCFERRLLIWGTFFVESIHFLLTVPILFVTMLLYGVKPDLLTILPNFVVCCGLLTLFSMGLSYAYAAANIYFRDLERIIGIIMRLWIYLTPIFIPAWFSCSFDRMGPPETASARDKATAAHSTASTQAKAISRRFLMRRTSLRLYTRYHGSDDAVIIPESRAAGNEKVLCRSRGLFRRPGFRRTSVRSGLRQPDVHGRPRSDALHQYGKQRYDRRRPGKHCLFFPRWPSKHPSKRRRF